MQECIEETSWRGSAQTLHLSTDTIAVTFAAGKINHSICTVAAAALLTWKCDASCLQLSLEIAVDSDCDPAQILLDPDQTIYIVRLLSSGDLTSITRTI